MTGNFAPLAGRLREVAAALDGREEIGDGFVARICAERALDEARSRQFKPAGDRAAN